MIKKIRIEQFVIIDKLELELQPGLTIFTGETGAGKSILLDALGLILGDPPAPSSIRQGSNQAIIEVTFAPDKNNPVWKFLISNDMVSPADEQFVIQRILNPSSEEEEDDDDMYDIDPSLAEEKKEEPEEDGNDVITINGKAIKLKQLRELGMLLAEIHGQFANQTMLAPTNQLKLLDLSGNFPPEIFENVRKSLADVHMYTQKLEEENEFINRYKASLPKIEKIVKTFESIGMREGFIEESQEEYARLLTARDSCEAFQSILALMIAGNGVIMGLTGANRILDSNEHLDEEKTADLDKYLKTALENARGAVNEMRRLSPEYEIDTAPIHHLEKVLETLKNISIENKIHFDDLTEFYLDMADKLERLQNRQDIIADLQDKLQKSKMAYLHHAHILHEKRVAAGERLARSICAELPPLRLNKAEFKVQVTEKTHNPWTDLGIDEVTFMARMNPGMPFSPVAETASGGELARMILGLKVVLQQVQLIPTLVFDEVDTGIGGKAAAAVGERIALLSANTQVLVITHSPQVASRGERHLFVSKSTDGITTTSKVSELTMEERIDEISNMLAGDSSTEESRAAARRLISEAEAAAEERRRNPQPIGIPLDDPLEEEQTEGAEGTETASGDQTETQGTEGQAAEQNGAPTAPTPMPAEEDHLIDTEDHNGYNGDNDDADEQDFDQPDNRYEREQEDAPRAHD